MGRIIITDSGEVKIPRSVKMQEHEVAELLGLYSRSLRANVKAILRAGLRQELSLKGGIMDGNMILPTHYSLKFIIAIAFRIDTAKANIFQSYILNRISNRCKPMYVQFNQDNNTKLN